MMVLDNHAENLSISIDGKIHEEHQSRDILNFIYLSKKHSNVVMLADI